MEYILIMMLFLSAFSGGRGDLAATVSERLELAKVQMESIQSIEAVYCNTGAYPEEDGEWRERVFATFEFGIDGGREKEKIKEYLKYRGTYKETPDGVNYRNGRPFSEYYINMKERRISFIIYMRNDYLGYGNTSEGHIWCTTVSFDSLEKQGSVMSVTAKDGTVHERSVDLKGNPLEYLSYEAIPGSPLRFIKAHREFEEYPPDWLNRFERFWIYKENAYLDQEGKWIGYKGNLYLEEEKEIDNRCIYDAQGRLESIKMELSEVDREDGFYIEQGGSGQISLYYRDNGSVDMIYYGYSTNYRAGEHAAEMLYDDAGRQISWNLLNSQVFYLYRDGSKTPFAKLSFMWMPYTSDDYAAYGNDTNIYLFQAN